MIGPSSEISKLLVTLLFVILCWYAYMDVTLYMRVQNYPIDRNNPQFENSTVSYSDVAWVSCDINPLCDVTVKALLLDHSNHYLFSPLAIIVDNLLKIDFIEWITPNSISIFHVFVAILAAKCVSSDSLSYRRIGVVLFEVRTFLDDMDGHVARARKHIKGERSEIGTSGYYMDGLCDGLGCIALMIGIFVFLKNNPPRRGYTLLPTTITSATNNGSADKDAAEFNILSKAKVTTKKVARKIVCFSLQLLISSTFWNRYIALYQDMLERENVVQVQYNRQTVVFQSNFFFSVAVIWRIINVHNMIHYMLVAMFCDKLWEFLRAVQYTGFAILFSAICVTEINILDVKNYIFKNLTK